MAETSGVSGVRLKENLEREATGVSPLVDLTDRCIIKNSVVVSADCQINPA